MSKTLDASLRYLQSQLGTNSCPLDLPYDTWAHLTPLSWIKMPWRTLKVSGFTVHLKYNIVSVPRRRGFLIMEFATSKRASKEELLSISRIRDLLCAIFMSNIVTADGIYLEGFATARPLSRGHASKYKFPNEAPTPGDWTTWIQF